MPGGESGGSVSSDVFGNVTTSTTKAKALLAGARSAFATREFTDAHGLIAKLEALQIQPEQQEQLTATAKYNDVVIEFYENGQRDPAAILRQTFESVPSSKITTNASKEDAHLNERNLSQLFSTTGPTPLYNYAVSCFPFSAFPAPALETLFSDDDNSKRIAKQFIYSNTMQIGGSNALKSY